MIIKPVSFFIFTLLLSQATFADNMTCKLEPGVQSGQCEDQVVLIGTDQVGVIESIKGQTATVKVAFIRDLKKISQLSIRTKSDAFVQRTLSFKQMTVPVENVMNENGGVKGDPSDRVRVDHAGHVYDPIYVFKDPKTGANTVLVQNANAPHGFSLVKEAELSNCRDQQEAAQQVNGKWGTLKYSCKTASIRVVKVGETYVALKVDTSGGSTVLTPPIQKIGR